MFKTIGATRRTLLTSSVAALGLGGAIWASPRQQAKAFSPEDYGAKGDGTSDDTLAFQALGQAISAHGGGTVQLRRNAVYRLGRQTFSGRPDGSAFRHQDMLTIKGARNLQIIGNGATLKLNDGLHYGSFHPVTREPHRPPKGNFSDADYAATIGWMINLVDCHGVRVADLVLDGNQDRMVVGGRWGDTGIQLRAIGLNLDGVTQVTIERVTSRNHGLDGFYIRTRGLDSAEGGWAGITFRDCRADRNGRQGLSITGGRGMLFENCSFTNTGQGRIASLPQAGVDIEPNGRDWVTAISFSGGQVANNKGVGILAPRGVNVSDVHVQNMEIWQGFGQGSASKGSSDAFWFSVPKVTVENCEIHGCVTNTTATTRVLRCRWDDSIHPVYGRSGRNRPYLLTNPRGEYREVRFETSDRKMVYAAKDAHFNRCTFIDKGPRKKDRKTLAMFGPSTTLTDSDFGRETLVSTRNSWKVIHQK